MPQDKQPFKLALAALFLDDKPRSAAQAFEELRADYAASRFFTPDFVAYQLHSLKAIGILKVEAGAEEARYALTEHGTVKVRHNL